MTDIDKAIREAMPAADAEALDRFAAEPSLIAQALGTLNGEFAWLNRLWWAAGSAAFLLALYCAWQAMKAPDARDAVIWMSGAGFLAIIIAVIKIYVWSEIHLNRVLRELKRLELQVARLSDSRRA